MVNKTISISQEINDKLKQEINASALISKLLIDYYKNNTEDTKLVINQIEEKKNQLIQDPEKQKEKLTELKSKENIQEINDKEVEQKRLAKLNQWKINVMTNFNEETGRIMTEQEFATYKNLWDNNLIDGLHSFIRTLEDVEKEL